MLGIIEISSWHYVVFLVCVLVFLALDLGVFHKSAHVVKFKEAIGWTTLWVTLSFVFGLFIAPALITGWEKQDTVEFITGYIIELSLSMDNVFVIALIFTYFRVPLQFQHRVLFWGILGALVMRGALIAAGAAIIQQFSWTLYLFGAFLVFTGIKMMFVSDEGVHPEKNPVLRLAKKFFPVTPEFHGQKFSLREHGKLVLTPLALVLLMVETTDLIFALDSIPAIFAVTTKPFIVFTSNVFAILGLRSLYFVLAGALKYFRYLKAGLSIVLAFIGVKMMLEIWRIKLPIRTSLAVVLAILLIAMLVSVLATNRASEREQNS